MTSASAPRRCTALPVAASHGCAGGDVVTVSYSRGLCEHYMWFSLLCQPLFDNFTDVSQKKRWRGPPGTGICPQVGRVLRFHYSILASMAPLEAKMASRGAVSAKSGLCGKDDAAHRERESARGWAELRGASTCYKASAAHRERASSCRHAEKGLPLSVRQPRNSKQFP